MCKKATLFWAVFWVLSFIGAIITIAFHIALFMGGKLSC